MGCFSEDYCCWYQSIKLGAADCPFANKWRTQKHGGCNWGRWRTPAIVGGHQRKVYGKITTIDWVKSHQLVTLKMADTGRLPRRAWGEGRDNSAVTQGVKGTQPVPSPWRRSLPCSEACPALSTVSPLAVTRATPSPPWGSLAWGQECFCKVQTTRVQISNPCKRYWASHKLSNP